MHYHGEPTLLFASMFYVMQIEKMPGMQAKKTEVVNSAFSRVGGRLIMNNGDQAVYNEVLLYRDVHIVF